MDVNRRSSYMTTFFLKMIALICMVIDHIGYFIPDMPVQMRWIGRLAAPVFIFCLCEGVDHTRSPQKYLLRLYISSVVLAVIQLIVKSNVNIFRTLFSIVTILLILKYRKTDRRKADTYLMYYLLWQVLTVCIISYIYLKYDQTYITRGLIPAVIGSVAFTEGGIPFILLGVILYLTKENKKKMAIAYVIFCAAYAILNLTPLTTYLYRMISESMFGTKRMMMGIMMAFRVAAPSFAPGRSSASWLYDRYQWMMIFALPLMLKYNGKKGRSEKWFFYVFYPVHIILLWLIQNYLVIS